MKSKVNRAGNWASNFKYLIKYNSDLGDIGMSITPDDWFGKFWPFRRIGGPPGINYFDDMFRGLDEMRREMERQFEQWFKDIGAKAPETIEHVITTAKQSRYSPEIIVVDAFSLLIIITVCLYP